MVFLGATPVGGPISGWIGEHLGARAGLALGGAVAVATGAVGLWLLVRRTRAEAIELERHRPAEPGLATARELSA
jgi:hypothetical protein